MTPIRTDGMPPPARLPALIGVRGLAVCLVWIYHVWLVAGNRPVSLLGLDLTPLVSGGWVGVDLFFVLSGFVLTWPYVAGAATRFDLRDFIRRRALRVIPAYYAQFLLLLLIAAYFGTFDLPSPGDTLAHLLFVHNFRHDWSASLNDAWWTLPIEWQFYLVFPAVLLLAIFGKRLIQALFLVVLIAILWRLCAMKWLATFEPMAEIGRKVWLLEQLPGRIDQFYVGMLAALSSTWLWRKMPLMTRDALATLFVATGSASVVALLYLLASHVESYWSGHWLLYVWHLACGIALAIFISGLALGGKLGNILFANKIMLWLGEVSYSVYLWHFTVLVILVDLGFFAGFGSPHYFLKIAGSSILPILCVATCSWLLSERPFLRHQTTEPPRAKALASIIRSPWPAIALMGLIILTTAYLGDAYIQSVSKNNSPACTERGNIDFPNRVVRKHGGTSVVGWTFDWSTEDKVRRVVITAGNVNIATGMAEQSRADVKKVFAHCRIRNPGFSIPLDISAIPENVSVVEVLAERASGVRYKIGEIPVGFAE